MLPQRALDMRHHVYVAGTNHNITADFLSRRIALQCTLCRSVVLVHLLRRILLARRLIAPLQQRLDLRETCFQCFDVSSLRPALPPDFIVGAVMLEPDAGAARRLCPIAFELSFAAQHTCYAFRLRRLAVIAVLSNTRLLLVGLISQPRRLP